MAGPMPVGSTDAASVDCLWGDLLLRDWPQSPFVPERLPRKIGFAFFRRNSHGRPVIRSSPVPVGALLSRWKTTARARVRARQGLRLYVQSLDRAAHGPVPITPPMAVRDLAISPDGAQVAVLTANGAFTLFPNHYGHSEDYPVDRAASACALEQRRTPRLRRAYARVLRSASPGIADGCSYGSARAVARAHPCGSNGGHVRNWDRDLCR